MKTHSVALLVNVIGIGFYCCPVYAINWSVNSFASAQEIYSDNITLAPLTSQKSAFVTSITPGVAIIGRSARTLLNLNYQMQNLYNARGDNQLTTFHQLRSNGNLMLVPNRFFLNVHSGISQQNTNNNQIANDNISGVGNRANVSTFGLTPTWTPRFGNYANGSARVNFEALTTDVASSANNNTFSDTLNVSEFIQLNSGIEFKRIKWGLLFNNTENNRISGNNVSFQNSSGTIRTSISKHFNVFAQGGYSNNSFQTSTNNNSNGLYYTLGGQWVPSRLYSVEAGYGNNRHITVNVSPMQRLRWTTTYRDNDIGLNNGKTWQTALNYRTRRSSWVLSHENDTTTAQAILLQQQTFTVDINPDPLIYEPGQFTVNIPTLTNDVIVRKIWNFSSSYNSAMGTLGASLFNEDRVFQQTNNKEKVSGVSANWNTRLTTRTSAYISPRWQQIDRGDAAKDNRYDVVIGLSRSITNHLNSKIEFLHLDQTSSTATNNFQENRATASLFMRF
ncbi:MAG: TIGR03016 family PEP-CTERM system-associated outer membrane protein [Methylovulum sp.]|nr:TIGR03016 family PEP-CTERM system-associated outer membrane protein [Methylovulum sp.]